MVAQGSLVKGPIATLEVHRVMALQRSLKGRLQTIVTLLLVATIDGATSFEDFKCQASELAKDALRPEQNISIQYAAGIGYSFLPSNVTVTRGLLIMPEDGVAPAAYAPFARAAAVVGYYAAILEWATPERAIKAMMLQPQLQYWTPVGHGHGGAVAAHLAVTLHPKVKALVLVASPLPADVNLTLLNLLLVVVYGEVDTVVTPAVVTGSFSIMAGDSKVVSYPHLGHYDFASSECVGNHKGKRGNGVNETVVKDIASLYVRAVMMSHWAGATEKALLYGDNLKLTPGQNDSKPYPGDEIRVQFAEVPIPGTNPQRLWWVFTPTQIEGGLVYYPGAAVDGRAYFPLAFEIAARGHLVVIVQQPLRDASTFVEDANAVLDSDNPLFSGVPSGKWAVGGHSWGAYSSSMYAIKFRHRIYANVLHAGAWAANFTLCDLPVVQIYGTLDGLSPGGYDRYRYRFTDPPPKGFGPLVNLETSKFITVAGGNHYQVGDYDYQVPDQIPTCSLEQQHEAFAKETVSFLSTCQPQVTRSSVC